MNYEDIDGEQAFDLILMVADKNTGTTRDYLQAEADAFLSTEPSDEALIAWVKDKELL